MGGSQHIGYLQLEVENANAHAGQELTGVIHFKLDQGIQASFLSLKFKGKESCQWTESRSEQDSEGKSRTVTDTYIGQAQIVRQKFPVFAFAGGFIDPGHFSFPFRFNLPGGIPGTFHLKEGPILADIKYKLTAQIDNVRKQVKKSIVDISVLQHLSQPIYSVSGAVTARLSTWCCCAQGSIQMKANFNKNAFAPGETAEFEVSVNNTSKLGINHIRGTLVRTLRLRDNRSSTSVTKRTLAYQDKVLQIPSGESTRREESVRFQLLIQDPTGELQQTASVHGSRIECVHALLVHADMNGHCMCCGEKPDIEQFVAIYPPQLPSVALPPMPVDWHPQVMPVVEFNAGQNYEYQPSAPLLPEEDNRI